MSSLLGYTRLLSSDETPGEDESVLRAAGAEHVVVEMPGKPRSHPRLDECLRHLGDGDVLLVSSVTRLSPTVTHYVATAADLTRRGVVLQSLLEPALSTDPSASVSGVEVVLALEALRRGLLSSRTRAGLADAAAAGKRPGRPSVMTEQRIAIALELRSQGRSNAHIARVLGVSGSAVRRALVEAGRD